MGIRDQMRDVAAAYLNQDETVQVVFGASTSGPRTRAWDVVGNDRVFVVTDQRILVLSVQGVAPKALGVVAELPRSTRLGPVDGVHTYLLNVVNGESLWVPRPFFGDIEEADQWRPVPAVPMPAGAVEDHSAHVTGRICARCGRPIEQGQPARLRGQSDWVHDVCPD